MYKSKKPLAALSAALAIGGAASLAVAAPAHAATALKVSLSSYGTGSSAVYNSAGNPVLTVGSSPNSYAEITVDNAPAALPSAAPAFSTDNYGNGSPTWDIDLAGGDLLVGYPAQAHGGVSWTVFPAAGSCADANAPQAVPYGTALAYLQGKPACAGNVTLAQVVADSAQGSDVSDTITGLSYAGMTLPGKADSVSIVNPGTQSNAAGKQITSIRIDATSSTGAKIDSYAASNLPPGLSVNTVTGVISGTPTASGSYSVAVSATDADNVTGSAAFTWNISGKPGDVVTVTSPGNQSSTVGDAISAIRIEAHSNLRGVSIASYGASNLPPGLSVNTVTGVISGTPTASGSYSVKISATDTDGTTGTATFTWTVSAASANPGAHVTYTGTITLSKMGLCLDDRGNASNNGAVVQVWRCNGLPNQVWKVWSDGTIRHNGLCLDARNYGTRKGTKLQLWTCTGGSNQQWDTRGWRIHYDNPAASGLVVDDTAFGGNGTVAELWTNNGGKNQWWKTY